MKNMQMAKNKIQINNHNLHEWLSLNGVPASTHGAELARFEAIVSPAKIKVDVDKIDPFAIINDSPKPKGTLFRRSYDRFA